MATFKICVRKQRKDLLYPIYIRITHNRKAGYIKTNKVADKSSIRQDELKNPTLLAYCTGDVDFALNHSTYKMARVYTKIDYSPAWELNEKVIDYIFFTNEDIDNHEDSSNSFERMSKYNLIRGEAFISGECVSVIEDSGFTNVEHVITKVLMSMHDDVPRPTKVQIKITNLDKKQIQLYQRVLE